MGNQSAKRRRVRLQLVDKKSHQHDGEIVTELVPRVIVTSSPLRSIGEIAKAVAGKPVRDDDPEWRELQAATKSFQDAKDGDTAALRERLRRGEATLEECQLAADLLTPGKVVRAAHRPVGQRTKDKRALVRWFLWEWLKAGEPQLLLNSANQPISIDKVVQQQFGQQDLSRTIVLDIIAELRKKQAADPSSAQ
jgi:hypothetical protein